MNKNIVTAATILGALVILVSAVSPAFAVSSISTSSSTRAAMLAQKITTAQQRADQEIARRITALNALITRINGMQKLSADEKTSLASSTQGQITLMNNLQAQIAADAAANSTTSLKADIQSITKAYRVYMLIIPQGNIEAAADRVLTVAATLTDLSTKLQARIASSTVNTSGAQAALTDMNAKIADANTQANAANSEVASLVPDNGVQTVMQSNTAALKDARSKIQAAQKDLIAAQKDASTIVKDLRISASITATSTSQ